MRNLLAAVVLAALAAVSGCGGSPADLDPVASQSALGWTVGTHRATGSYTCRLTPFSSATFQASTLLYLTQRPVPNSWYLDLLNDTAASGGVTLDRQPSYALEAADNGAVVYSTALTSVYVHKAGSPVEYTHDESAPPYAIQVLPADPAHLYGQLVVAMYPKGASDPAKGECAEQVTAYLTIQP